MTQTTQNIPQGYKQTPVGVIPEDWEVKKLKEIGAFYKGKGISKSDLTEDGLKAIRYGEIYTTHHFYIKDFYSFITETTAKQSFKIEKGDLLFTGSGETAEEIGKSVAFLGDETAYAGGDIIILRPKENKFNSKFLGFTTNHDICRSQTYSMGQGNSVVHIYSSNLGKVKLPIPPLPEQEKIADCLTTWDTAIEKLSELIKTKKQYKKGLMQQLLTGKTRLDGFTDEWKEMRLGEITSIKKGDSITSKNIITGNIPVIAGGKISPYFHNVSNYENVITVSASGAYAGYVSYHKEKIWASDCSVIQPIKNKSSIIYIYSLLKYFQEKIYLMQSGGAQPHIYPDDLKAMKFFTPPIEEQTAIAEILSTADKEISLLEEKLVSFKTQKKGLMQVLLTGKKRLVNK